MILLSSSILIIIAAFFIYRKKPVQFALRAVAILLMYLIVSNYVLRVNIGTSRQNPTILIDHSASMKAHLPKVIEMVSHIGFPHTSYFFQDTVITEQQPEELGSYTDITSALRKSDKMHPSAIILITDGNHNSGTSPLTALKDMMAPVYAYGVGAQKVRDIEILDVHTPAYVYQNDSILIDVIVESSGFQSGEGQISVDLSSGKNVAKTTFLLSDSPSRQSLRFASIADMIGDLRIDVRVLPGSGELSYENNESSASLTVIKDKIKVLYCTDHISFNTKFIRKYLNQDKNVTLSSLARHGGNEFLHLESATRINALPNPEGYDVIILDNVNLSRPPWSTIPEYVKAGQGLLLIGVIEGINDIWQRLLPMNSTGGIITGVYQMRINEPFSALKAEDYPPVRMIARTAGSKDDATIVAYAGNLPVVGYRREGRGVVYQISIIDLAAWDFVQRGVKGREILGPLNSDIIRFLSHFGRHDRLVLAARREEYPIGETVNLTLQSYDSNLSRLGGGDFYLVTEDGFTPFYETKSGSYETSIIFETTGKHQLVAKGNMNGDELTSNKIEVTIAPRPVETETRLNQNLLERIAAGTNGRFYRIDEFEHMAPPKSSREKEIIAMNFNSPLLYFLVFLMLTADWVLRRRGGIT